MSETEVQWQSAIGRFLIAFGRIEWFTYELLVDLPTERIFDAVKTLTFTPRVKLVKTYTAERIKEPELVREVIDLLDRVSSFKGTRNTIAHNPVDLSLFDGPDGIDVRETITKFSSGDSKEITLEALQRQCEKMEELAVKAYELRGKVHAYLWP